MEYIKLLNEVGDIVRDAVSCAALTTYLGREIFVVHPCVDKSSYDIGGDDLILFSY